MGSAISCWMCSRSVETERRISGGGITVGIDQKMVAASVFCSEKAQRPGSEEPSQPLIEMPLEHNYALAKFAWQKYAQLIMFECDSVSFFLKPQVRCSGGISDEQ